MIQTEHYFVDHDFFKHCEEIATDLEVPVDYLLDEFFIDGELRMDSISVNIQ